MDRKALIGLLSGITVVIAVMIGVGLMNTRPAEGADAATRPQQVRDCGKDMKPVEPGYGVNPVGDACGRR